MNKQDKKVLEAIRVYVQGEEPLAAAPTEDAPTLSVDVRDLTPDPAKIDIKIGQQVKIKVKEEEPKIKIRVKDRTLVYLQVRKTLDGNYMIYDHPLYDVVLMPRKNKVITFPKKDTTIDAYSSQDSFFDYMMRHGMILPDTVQGGNAYGSLEASYPKNDVVDTISIFLFVIYNFFKEEVDDMRSALDYSDAAEDMLTNPDERDSTELGEVPHSKKKGSIEPGIRPYGLIYRI